MVDTAGLYRKIPSPYFLNVNDNYLVINNWWLILKVQGSHVLNDVTFHSPTGM